MNPRWVKCGVLCACVMAAMSAWAQQSEDWLPVTPQALQIKEVPEDPGAPAVQLYYADFRDDVHQSEFIYKRIKVLNEKGKKYADVEIQIPPHYGFSDLQARTIHPNGSIIEFKGKTFEKVVVRYQGELIVARIFTFPEVTIGSIVEYKYRLTWDHFFYDPVWAVQHELYTLKENFSLRRYTGPLNTRHMFDRTHLSYVTANMPAKATPKETWNGVELQVENVPAFKPEKYMPPEANFKGQVQFFYGGREIESPDAFWNEVGVDWHSKSERFIGNYQELKVAAAQIIGGETDPEHKLRKLYARAQQTRNLSYERERTRKEAKDEALKPNENVMDVFTRDYGFRNEITELFVALARAAGFQAELLRVSSREDRVFDPKLLSKNQLETEIVRVKLNNSDLFLDPGTRFCPFGLVAWNYTSVTALQLDKNGGSFVIVPTATADKNITRRNAELELSADGKLRGEVTIEFKGNQAIQHRLEALDNDDAGRKQGLEQELATWLPAGALVQLEEVQGWESSAEPLVARFAVELEASLTGKRLVVPANLFRSLQTDAFAASERKYPVYFPYTYEEIDKVTIRVAPGYSPEALPAGQDIKSASTRFITTRSAPAGRLVLTRALVVNSIYFQPEQYGSLRDFFYKLKAADDEQIVLNPKNK